MDVKNAYLPETAHRHFEVRLFNRCVEPFERPFREHWHFLFEAALIKGGSGVYTTQRAVYPIRPGDVFLFACNEIHCVTRIDPGAPLQLMNIHIDPSYLWPENGAPLTPRFLAMPFSHSAAFENRLAADTRAARDIAALMLDVEREFDRRDSEYALMVRSKLTELFVTLLRETDYLDESAAQGGAAQHAETVRAAIDYIREHLIESISLRDIASAVQMSPNYFCTVFRKTVGVTPWDYITSARVDLAMRLMEQFPDETLLTIAVRSGFNNTQNFNKMFAKHTGCTPSEYRRSGYSLGEL